MRTASRPPGARQSGSRPRAPAYVRTWLRFVTARYTKLLPPGMWLAIHRFSIVIFAFSWMHGLLAGTDSAALLAFYVLTGASVLAAGAYRYWVSRAARPSFATSLQEEPRS